MAQGSLPLADIRVLDVTVARAGPNAVRQLADWGAQVIRIESPHVGGDLADADRDSADFQNLHRNKRALALDLKQDRGREILLKLAGQADVLIENFRADVKHRLGFDYESVRRTNPRIVYGSISGFGQEGPYRDRGGVDQIAQGMGGLMSITGLPGQGPVRVGIAISDMAAGLYLAIGILIALRERERSGEGQWVQTSLLEAQIAMLDFQAARWLIDKDVPGQAGNHHPTGIPMGCFPTADGHMNIAAPANRMFRTFCAAIGAQALLERPEYKDPRSRSRHRDVLCEEISEYLRKRTTEEWVELLNGVGIPCGPIYSVDQVFADPQVVHLGVATPVEHRRRGTLHVVGSPVHLQRTPQKMRLAAPDRGEHSDEILRELGYSDEAIRALRGERVI
jgi:formyl-CoA transferase